MAARSLIDEQIEAQYVGRACDLFGNYPAHAALETLTIAVLVLKNGLIFTGAASSSSPDRYDEAIGSALALASARDEVSLSGAFGPNSYHQKGPPCPTISPSIAADPAHSPKLVIPSGSPT